MKYLLIIQLNPETWESLSDEERAEIAGGQEGFMETITATGEMVGTHALADPSQSAVVRGRPGAATVTDGPFLESKEYMGGFYVVDCESSERAYELAAMIPGTDRLPVEVRPVVFTAGYGLAEPDTP
ncbi:YciI family protein [Actinomycetospora endophytica]|uniref:YciI family protein n=1 Tax=Actinomycetospora endophytica TaxID=2291215 RepID=A0ABS8PBR7_9PSEU|nr:YciI family protein [Actinomycetospora endophytica]MCD2195734.1 YciI family protein [Actinomycetospora endophytica]